MIELRLPGPVGKMEPIGVMIVGDHEAIRTGLATFLEAYDDLALVAQAESAGEALRLCQELQPDVVLVDLGMSSSDGVEVIRAMRRVAPDTRVIAMSGYNDQQRSSEAQSAGAAGCLRKDTPIHTMAAAIRAVRQERRERTLDKRQSTS